MKIVSLYGPLVGNIIEGTIEIRKIEKSIIKLRSECNMGEVKFQEDKLARKVHARDRYVEVSRKYAGLHP